MITIGFLEADLADSDPVDGPAILFDEENAPADCDIFEAIVVECQLSYSTHD